MVGYVAGETIDVFALPPHQDGVVKKPLQLDGRLRHEAVHVQRVRQILGVGEVERADLLRQRSQHRLFRNGARADQERAEPPAHRALNLQRPVDVGLLHGIPLDQHLAQPPGLTLLRSHLL